MALFQKEDGSYAARSPEEVIATLNELVLTEMDTEYYFTLVLVILDLKTGHATLSQAGHPHPVVQRADGSIEQDGPGGFPVGLLSDVEFTRFEINLNPGDRLMLFSDGVTECPDLNGTMLGESGAGAAFVQVT